MSKQKSKWIYMHTLNGRPAYFDGDQIVYGVNEVRCFCLSLQEIRKQQKQSDAWRKGMGYGPHSPYSYTKFRREDLP